MPATNAPIQSPPSKVLLADAAQPSHVPGRWVLVLAGTLLIGLFVAGLIVSHTAGSETTKTTIPSAAASKGSGSSSGKSSAGASVTRTTTKSVPSEGELLALLGTGAVLVLAGALYSRLSAIKLPGGAEIDLSPEEKDAIATEVATQATQAAEATGATHEEVAHTTAQALATATDSARAMKLRSGGGNLNHAAIQQAARLALQQVTTPLA